MIIECEKCHYKNYVTKQYRSLNENSYYWHQIVTPLSEFTGYTTQEIHDALKIKFLKIVKGKIETIRSTTDLSVYEFETYCEQIRTWASQELNCYLNKPNETFDNSN